MSTSDTTINQLNAATIASVLIISVGNFVLGSIGLILNVFVFNRPALRREPCSVYFLSSTYFNLFIVFIILPVRIVSNAFNIDLANDNLGICKIEYFTFYAVRAISCWLIACASLDRFLHSSTSVSIRRFSSLKTARMAVGIITITISLLYSHMIIFYVIDDTSDSLGNITSSCNSQKGIYRTFITVWHMIFYSLCPSFLMFFFGILTVKNIRRRRGQVLPTAGEGNRMGRRTNVQLLRMLTAQVLIIMVSILPFTIDRLYIVFTGNLTKSPLRLAQENLAFGIAIAVTYFAHTSTFYLYTLTGDAFRKELFKIIRPCFSYNRNVLRNTRNDKTNEEIALQIVQQMNVVHNVNVQ